ncbi:MAG: porin [Planctomycetota bacterium]
MGCNLGGCDGGCDSGCDSACGVGGCLTDLVGGDCCIGDPWKLFDAPGSWDVGGWISLGYHTDEVPLFNDRADELNLHQAWLYAEKAIDTSCGFDIGGRIDYLYGIDAQDTQAFGIANDHWDNDFDNGAFGSAIPQLYVEAGYGDLSVKVGHFYTIIGWEVVGATGNFFYSHAYTFFNSEPFTHTGALATYNVSDDVTVYGGYVLGWDSGFEDNGDAFLGGISLGLTDDLTVTYATIGGRFNAANTGRVIDGVVNNGRNGYMHSIVADYALTDSVQYIFQSDYLDTEDNDGAGVADSIGINQYLIKTINDCWAVGGRFEWYNSEGIFTDFGTEADIYALTLGVNYRQSANLIVRPEIRWDWDDDLVALDEDNQFTFGVDSILTF